jgi:hypothetical protein
MKKQFNQTENTQITEVKNGDIEPKITTTQKCIFAIWAAFLVLFITGIVFFTACKSDEKTGNPTEELTTTTIVTTVNLNPDQPGRAKPNETTTTASTTAKSTTTTVTTTQTTQKPETTTTTVTTTKQTQPSTTKALQTTQKQTTPKPPATEPPQTEPQQTDPPQPPVTLYNREETGNAYLDSVMKDWFNSRGYYVYSSNFFTGDVRTVRYSNINMSITITYKSFDGQSLTTDDTSRGIGTYMIAVDNGGFDGVDDWNGLYSKRFNDSLLDFQSNPDILLDYISPYL